jgi:threonine/homoserine/homoserine lactone efflux protein
LTAFALAGALLVVLPGPDTLVVVRATVRGGRRRAAWTGAGVLTGLVVWISATALGLAALLRASHEAYLVLKIAGAAYLVWLGIQSLRSRSLGERLDAGTPAAGERAPRRFEGYGAGLATNLLNPKIGVLFVAMLPGFVPAGAAVGTTSLLLGAIYIAETAIYLAVLVGMATPVVRHLSDARVRRRLDRLMGAVFVGFGVHLVAKG